MHVLGEYETSGPMHVSEGIIELDILFIAGSQLVLADVRDENDVIVPY